MQPQKRHWLACWMGFGSGVLFKSDNFFYVWETYKLLHYFYRLGKQVHKTYTHVSHRCVFTVHAIHYSWRDIAIYNAENFIFLVSVFIFQILYC
jgi:hypothetical protein